MPVLRTATLVAIPVHIRIQHLIQQGGKGTRELKPNERVHDSHPHHEKVVFDVEVDWTGRESVSFDDRIEAVFNYSSIYHMLSKDFHERGPLESPLESILDLVVSKARLDPRVVAVRASATRPNILLSGSVRVSVNWVCPQNGHQKYGDQVFDQWIEPAPRIETEHAL
jgi:dihydroneopterin aldolase